MKVNEAHTEFSTKLSLGVFSFIINLDVMGFEMKVEDLVSEALSFNNVIICGDEPFKQKEDIKDLVNKLVSKNPNISVSIFTDGNTKPVGLNKFSNFKNVKYTVFGKLKRSGVPYDIRVSETCWKWFAVAGAKFVFDVYETHELDEIITIQTICQIHPSQIYLNIMGDNFQDFCLEAKANSYNIYFEVDKKVFGE